MVKKTLVLLFAVLLFDSCVGFLRGTDEPLTLMRRDNTSNNFKLNGYYYNKDSANSYFGIYFFFENGVFLRDPCVGQKIDVPLEKLDSALFDYNFILKNKMTHKYSWGAYQVKNNELIMEGWLCEYQCEVFNQVAHIVNDTLLKLDDINFKGKKSTIFTGIFQFRKFDFKPDSTNNFIK